MTKNIIEENIDPINDYQSYREDQDTTSFADQAITKFAKVKPKEEKPQEPEVSEAPEEGLFKRFAKDVTRGTFAEGPRAMVSGAAKGINEMLDTANDFNQFLGDSLAKGAIKLLGSEEQQKNLEKVLEKKQKEDKDLEVIPEPKFGMEQASDPKTQTGNLIEGITQFITGFGAVGKGMKAAKITARTLKGKRAQAATQAALGDMAAFDEQESRLSNLIESNPKLKNFITNFLQSDEDDSVAEAKLKQGLEGLGLGILGEALGKSVSVLRKNRKVKQSLEAELETKKIADEQGLFNENLKTLGKPQSNKFVYNKIAAAKEETENLTAEQIEQLAKQKPSNADEIAINFARIDGPEDLKEAMQAFANETKLLPKVKEARRGVRSNEVTLKAAEDIDGFKTLLERRSGQPLNAEQITSARNFYYETTNKLMELAKKAASPEATEIDQYAFRKIVATHHAVQKEVLGARAEAGRALQAWSIASEGTPKEKLKGMEAILDSFGGIEASKDLAQKLSQFEGGQLTVDQINHITQKSALARSGDAVVEAWTAGLLTNPVTHVKNLTSNTFTTLMAAAERYGEALFPQSDVTITEANAFVKGLMESQKQAFANAGRAFRTGQVGFGQGKIELPRVRASSRDQLDLQGIAKPFGYGMDYYGRVVNTSFKALAAGDEYSKTVLYRAQLNALSTREGIKKGLKGDDLKDFIAKSINDPDQILQQESRDFANYATFTKELGKSGKSFQRILQQNPVLKFVVPFYKTPTNIFKYTLERTPLAPMASQTRKDLSAGGTRQAAALAKMGMGSSIMALGVDMSVNGNITGAGPSDFKKRAALKRIGWQPNSIKIGDKFYSYQGLEPLSTLMSFSTSMAEVLTNYEMYDIEAQDEVEKISTATVLAISEATVNKTFMQGISNIMEALSDPDRFGESYIQRTLSSFVPAGVAATERALNPQKEAVKNIGDAFKARIPGFSDSVAKKRNVYGEIIQYRYPDEVNLSKNESAVLSLFNPFYISAKKDSDLDRFLLREGYFVGMPSKVQTFDDVKVKLTDYPEVYSRLLELRGQETELIQYGNRNMKEALEDLVNEDLPQSIQFFSNFTDDDERQNVITKIVRDYNNAAKKQLREEFPIVDQIILEEKIKQEQQREFN